MGWSLRAVEATVHSLVKFVEFKRLGRAEEPDEGREM